MGASFWSVDAWSIFLADAVFKWNYIATLRKICDPQAHKFNFSTTLFKSLWKRKSLGKITFGTRGASSSLDKPIASPKALPASRSFLFRGGRLQAEI
jgi:hypothetical protein